MLPKIYIALLVSALCANAIPPANPAHPRDDGWKKLTLRQKIGQTMLMLPDRTMELKLGNGSLPAYFKRYPVGGFFMGWKLWEGIAPADKLTHIRKRTVEYQAASQLPLLFQEDYESGINLPGMTSFPNEMTLGAANDPTLAYGYGAAVAKECKSIGVKWVLHPVADLNVNPLNPIMNVRSIGDDPDRAIRLLSRQIKGLQDNGVAATIKHFPGDGVDSRDQHLLTSCNSLPLSVWRQLHGKVFQALIDSGVACIMPGHITLPAYQTEKINGVYPPATLSKELLTGLLKGDMHFPGVIVSDAMTMGGFRGYYDDELEGEVHSFLAGVDILLWPSYRFMDTLEARINRGEIPMARLDDAVQRVWALKERFGLLDPHRQLLEPTDPADQTQADATADAISEKAITLVRDKQQALPLNLKKDKKILVVGITPVGRKGGDTQLEGVKAFAQDLREKGFDVDFRHNILYETQGWTDGSPAKYDRIIAVVARSPHTPFGPMQLWDDEAQSVWAINAMPKEKLIVISLGSPYMANEYFQRVNTFINAYSNTPVMHKALVRALTGEIPMTGSSPVTLTTYDQVDQNARGIDTLSILRESRPRQGLPNVFAKLRIGQPVTVAYLGGSITQAANGYREQSTAWLQQRYPGAKITAINAGVGGTRSDLGAFRLQRQVLDQHPDLVFVEFAVNDKDTDPAGIHESMEGIVRQIWKSNPSTDICFVYTMTADMAPVLSQGKLPAAARAMEDIAEYYQIPSVDMCLGIIKLFSEGTLVFKGKPGDYPGKMVFSADNVHPYPQTGHRLYTEALARSLGQMTRLDKAASHPLPAPLTPNRLEQVQMIPADKLQQTGAFAPASKTDAGNLSPDPFPVLLKTARPGSAISIHFTGTMVGLYDVIGPGTGTWDVILDGQPYRSVTRFDAFATYWRPHYVLLNDLPLGEHTVEFRLSATAPDKKALLGTSTADYLANPDRYKENAGYAGFLLLAGTPARSSAPISPGAAKDWLINPPAQKAEVLSPDNNNNLVLTNGLLKRVFHLQPNLACISFKNLGNGQELLRSVKPEGRITINGKEYAIGGLYGQKENAYFLPEWLVAMTAHSNDFQYQSYSTSPLQPYLHWKPAGWTGNSQPAAGTLLTFHYRSNADSLKGVTININYECYDGIPLLVKWLSVDNKGNRPIRIDRVVNEVLGITEEESSVEGSKEQMAIQHGLYVETNFAFNNSGIYHISDQTTHWKADSSYTSQVHYRYQTPCLLEVYPEKGPGITLTPGGNFRSVRTQELLIDTYDRERRGLSIRRMYRILNPWTTENPIFMHLVSKNDGQVRTAVDQCAATGYEMLILSFGSHCDIEDTTASNIKKWKELAAYAHGKGIRIGGYSLFSSRRISDEDDVIDPVTGRPDAAAFFGQAPCLGSRWGLAYLERIKYFISRTGFDLLEHDGPYPGDVCASLKHPGHKGLDDSQWKQMELQKGLYRWCNEHGVYVNAPDWYFQDGSNKIPLGYREVNFALSRSQQKILNRQNIYDGLWDKTPPMCWGFVPLTEYHGGGPESVLEPLSEHLSDYRQLMVQYYGAGVQACYRGPRLYDTDSTRGMVTKVVGWYKAHRDILNKDIIHLRRPDGRDWDGILHVSAAGKERGLAMLYNPLDHSIEQDIDLPLYYTGLTNTASIRVEDAAPVTYTLDRSYKATVTVTIPAGGYTWLLIEDPESPENRENTWMSFKRTDVQVAGRPCIIVEPRTALPGNPWIWRTEFFGHEPQGDSALAAKGFHVVYMDMQNLYGAPAAMSLMDSFYTYLTDSWHLSSKTVLEGFSRGGLYAFNWASRDPGKVGCLYVDAPVCDFKSWPGGKGKGEFSKENWELLMKVYHFRNEKEALAYRGNPIDNLRPIAKAHIPILCVCGDADTVVPMAENIDIVQQRFQKMGGKITMIVKPNNGHHPHSLKDPTPIVDFVMASTNQ